ncbi:MAG: hypothetical protein U5L06_13240 [Rhodovibrio sp.]|nr:hypothetical protein [Rhodovibrio sp.]
MEAGLDDPLGDHRQHQIPRPPVRRPVAAAADQQLGQAELLGHAHHGGDVAVRQRARDGQRLLGPIHRDATLEEGAQALDQMLGPVGEVGHGALFDLAVDAVTLPQQDGGRRLPIGDRLDVHGLCESG